MVSATVAAIAAIIGPSPLELSTPAMSVLPGEADGWVLGLAAGITETQIADGAVGIEIVDVILHVTTAGAGGSTATVRTAVGGAGTALSSALPTATTGVARSVLTTAAAASDGAALYLRRSDNAFAGFIDIVAIRAA